MTKDLIEMVLDANTLNPPHTGCKYIRIGDFASSANDENICRYNGFQYIISCIIVQCLEMSA